MTRSSRAPLQVLRARQPAVLACAVASLRGRVQCLSPSSFTSSNAAEPQVRRRLERRRPQEAADGARDRPVARGDTVGPCAAARRVGAAGAGGVRAAHSGGRGARGGESVQRVAGRRGVRPGAVPAGEQANGRGEGQPIVRAGRRGVPRDLPAVLQAAARAGVRGGGAAPTRSGRARRAGGGDGGRPHDGGGGVAATAGRGS